MRSFKPMILALATAVAAFTGNANAQDYSIGWDPRSGDVWVDNYLGDVNRYGSRYREPFVNEMVRYYGAPRDLVVDLLELAPARMARTAWVTSPGRTMATSGTGAFVGPSSSARSARAPVRSHATRAWPSPSKVASKASSASA